LRIPFSFTGHAADLFRDRLLLTPKLREAAFVNCISEWHRRFYAELVPRPDEEYPLVRCGVDPDNFPQRSSSAGERIHLFAVGRLVRKKGFDLLLEALADPEVRDLNWDLLLIGDGPERENLNVQQEQHPAKDRITLAGSKPNHVVREEMAKADIFVLPCRVDLQGDRDGIPVVLMEAMAAGATVISGDVPSIRELVQDGINGRMIPSEDVPALIRALREVLLDASLLTQRIQAARHRIEEEFSLSTTVERIRHTLLSRKLVTS
jgi:glycosyltransferase involved in cell wall biosynthesis